MTRSVLFWALAATVVAVGGVSHPRPPDPVTTARPGPAYNPAWGEYVRGWTMWEGSICNMAVCTSDGYFITGPFKDFESFYVYTTMGSFVRSVSAAGVRGTCDGTGKTHLGAGYFASIEPGDSGVSFWAYSPGGYPGSSPISSWPHLRGRGLSWDGRYYYVSSFWTPISKVNSSGSVVGTVPGSPWGYTLYGHATPAQKGGRVPYIYVTCQRNDWLAEHSLRTGARVRSLSITLMAGGLDIGWSDGYFYLVEQSWPRFVGVWDGELSTYVAPTSLGKVKALFR